MALLPFGSPPTPDATSSVKGKLKLTNDLGGTAALPTVVATHLASALPLVQGGTGANLSAIAKGGLISGTGTGTVGITAIGGDGTVLSADAASAGGVKWIAAGGTGTVTTVSVSSANGVSGSVANATTTPAITLTLGAITPTTVNSVILSGSATPTLAVTGTSSISGANTGDQTITLTSDVTGSGTGSFTTTIKSSVALAGSPTTTTQATTDNSTKIATTAYVTTGIANAIAGVNPAVAVQAATTAASDTSGFTYSNGASGIGATLTGSVNTALTVDGYTFTALGQRLLVKNDTQSPSGAFNGVYYVTQVQTGILAPVLTRALDYDMPSDINNTGAIPVVNGTVNGTTSWLLTSTVNTVGTDPLTYIKFSANPTTVLSNTLTSAHLLVGNASNVATDTAITGNVTISNTGVTTIGAGQVTDSMLTGTVGPAHGGTGVANNASSTLTISGSFGTTLTVSGTTSVTLPTSGTLATLSGSETLSNKILSDVFIGNGFQSQNALVENLTLGASTNYVYDNLLEIGSANTLEIPATSTLEIESYIDQPYLNNNLLTAPAASVSLSSQSPTTQNIVLPPATNYLVANLLEVGAGTTFEITPTSSLEIETFVGKNLISPQVVTSINDTNGNKIISTPATPLAVNAITVTNSATGTAPSISATGSDININLALTAKGNGLVKTSLLRQDDTSNTYQLGNSVMLTGWGVITPGAVASASEVVSFGVTFLQRPIVIITGGGDATSATTYGSGALTIKQFLTEAHTITTTGFTAAVLSKDSTAWSAGNTVFYQWMAIGEI